MSLWFSNHANHILCLLNSFQGSFHYVQLLACQTPKPIALIIITTPILF